MAARNNTEVHSDAALYRACALYCDDPPMRQKEIATALGLSEKKVSALLNRARREGLVRHVFCPPAVDCELRGLPERLHQAGVRKLIVVPDGIQSVGSAAARFFEEHGSDGTTVVLDGGKTVASFVHSLISNVFANLRIIPICADPASYAASAFELATHMAAKYPTGTVVDKIPFWPGGRLDRVANSICRRSRSARFVFLGAGPLEKGYTALDFVDHLGLPREGIQKKYRRKVQAFVGYCALDDSGHHRKIREIDRRLRRTLNFPDLQHLARRSHVHTVVLASGTRKADAVAAVLAARICNTLIIDQSLAGRLLKRLTPSS